MRERWSVVGKPSAMQKDHTIGARGDAHGHPKIVRVTNMKLQTEPR